jgi:NAD(P) transhydrogenase subunit alpha
MSATNAISGISLVGSIVIAGGTGPHHSKVAMILGFIAVVCSTTNVVGGFVITDPNAANVQTEEMIFGL